MSYKFDAKLSSEENYAMNDFPNYKGNEVSREYERQFRKYLFTVSLDNMHIEHLASSLMYISKNVYFKRDLSDEQILFEFFDKHPNGKDAENNAIKAISRTRDEIEQCRKDMIERLKVDSFEKILYNYDRCIKAMNDKTIPSSIRMEIEFALGYDETSREALEEIYLSVVI
jgi:hypothetical protein